MSRDPAHAQVETLVIGAGVSGLAYAHALGADADVLVLEASSQVGGLLRTEAVEGQPGAQFEWGAEALQTQLTLATELSASTGVELRPASPLAKRRFIVQGKALVALPASPVSLISSPLLSFTGKLRALGEPFRASKTALDGSVADFARHRFGREVLASFVDPFISGVHAGDAEQVSVRATFPALVEMVERHGSVLGGMRHRRGGRMGLFRPAGGMQRLPEGLARRLGTRLRLDCAVRELRREAGEFVAVTDAGPLRARRVILATDGRHAAQLLAELTPDAARELAAMQRESLVAVVHAWPRDAVGHALDGFGFLAPSREKLSTLGTLFSTSIDPSCAPEGSVVLRTLMGGARAPELVEWSDAALLTRALDENTQLLGLHGAPSWSRVVRYPNKIPRYDLDHPRRLAAIEADVARIEGLGILGNSLRALGVNALLARAKELAGKE